MAKPKLALIPAAQGSKFYSVLPSSGVGDFDFTRSGSATRINSQGLIETVANGVSRLNYPLIDGKVVGCPSHLLEPQSTNLLTYSEDFSNAAWLKLGASVVSNSAISPDGTLNASSFIEDTSNGTHILYRNNVITGAGQNTLSVKVKANGRNWILLYDAENGDRVFFDLENGIAGSAIGSPDAFSINALPNGWYDISLTSTSTAKVDFQMYLAESDGVSSYTGNGVSGIYVYGAQLEFNSYQTSYIPTVASTVTRSEETANGSGDAATFNDSEGVLMFEGSALANDGTFRILSLSNGGTSNEIKIQLSSVDNTIGYGVVVGGFPQIDSFYTINSTLLNNKIAAKYKENDFSLFVNGFEVIVDTNGSVFSQGTLNELSFERGNNTSPFYSSTKQIQYYDSVLTDSELETLTSWVSFSDMANGQLYTIE